MTLVCLILIPFLGGLVAWLSARWSTKWPRWICLAALALDLLVLIGPFLIAAPRVAGFFARPYEVPGMV